MATGRGSGCPSTVHVQGSGTDAFGNEAQFGGKYVNLPAPDAGCATLFLEVEGSLVP